MTRADFFQLFFDENFLRIFCRFTRKINEILLVNCPDFLSKIFRISEIPKFGNFSEIFRKFRKFRKIPEIVPGKSVISGVFTNDYSLKPGKNPRIFPPKSRGNPRHFRKISGNFRKFRKIPEIVPGKSTILERFTNDYSLKPGKNP